MTHTHAFDLCMEAFGFLVICWDATERPDAFIDGDPVTEIWGKYPAPEPLEIGGRATRKQFSDQFALLLKHGYPETGVKPVPPGWRLSKVVRVARTGSTEPADAAEKSAKKEN